MKLFHSVGKQKTIKNPRSIPLKASLRQGHISNSYGIKKSFSVCKNLSQPFSSSLPFSTFQKPSPIVFANKVQSGAHKLQYRNRFSTLAIPLKSSFHKMKSATLFARTSPLCSSLSIPHQHASFGSTHQPKTTISENTSVLGQTGQYVDLNRSPFRLPKTTQTWALAPFGKTALSARNSSTSKDSSQTESNEDQSAGGEQTQTQREFWANILGILGALANWMIPLAAIASILNNDDPEKINVPLTATLVGYSSLFIRWSISIHPRNYPLFLCHLVNLVAQLGQTIRGATYRLTSGGKASAEELPSEAESENQIESEN